MPTTSGTGQATLAPARGLAEAHFARVAERGSAHHPHLVALLRGSGAHAARDLADCVHLLCHLHGRFPGLVDIALEGCADAAAREWLNDAAHHFERERLYLVQLTAAVGPLPSTPGGAETESVIQGQRHAIETLARSERKGCALGAAVALVSDWPTLRALLDRAAARAGVECPLPTLPGETSIARAIEASIDSPASQRALTFGGEQLLLQHNGLLTLLEARAEARLD